MRISTEAGGQNDRSQSHRRQSHRATEDVGCRETAEGERVRSWSVVGCPWSAVREQNHRSSERIAFRGAPALDHTGGAVCSPKKLGAGLQG
jgi:hypothetical protein